MSRLGDWIDRKITEAQTCSGCGCNADTWRKDCGCTRYDCECSATAGPDTDGEDTFEYQRPDGTAESAKGKWWLGGRCSLACGDVACPPCQREELHKADQLPPTSLPWLSGPPPPLADEDRAMPDTPERNQFGEPVEVCGICDQPGSAHPKAAHSPEGYDPEDGHHYCPKGRRCPTCQAPTAKPDASPTLADVAREWLSELQFADVDHEDFDDHDFITDDEVLRAADKTYDGGLDALQRDLGEPEQPTTPTAPDNTGGAHDMNSKQLTGQSRWQSFLDWLARLFGPGIDPGLPPQPRGSRGRIDAALARPAGQPSQRYIGSPPEPDVATVPQDADTRPQPAPQDLDAITNQPPPPAVGQEAGGWTGNWLKVDYGPEWCNCGGMAGAAHQHSSHAPGLNVGGFMSPPPVGGTPPSPPNLN